MKSIIVRSINTEGGLDMLRKKPMVPPPDFGDKPIGVWIMELEKRGLLGHFKDDSLFFFDDTKGNRVYSTRDYWIVAGMDPTPIFKKYLGNDEQKIESIDESLRYLKTVIDSTINKLLNQMRTTNTDLMLRKLFVLFDATYGFYRKDREARENLAKNNPGFASIAYEENRNITLTIINGLNVMIENCILFQHDLTEYSNSQSFDELIDVDILSEIYLYALASHYYTLLNLSKKAKNYEYCSGLIITPSENIPIEGIIRHPLVYSSALMAGNLDVLKPTNEKEYLKSANTTEIGIGFKKEYSIEFLEVMSCFNAIKEVICNKGRVTVSAINEKQLKEYLINCYPDIPIDQFLEYFSLKKEKLTEYVSEDEPYIYKMGCNKNRLEIRPIIKLDNGTIYVSFAALDKAMQLWFSYIINGGRPYTGIDAGHGDSLIDGCSIREQELGDILVNILCEMLEKHFPTSLFKDKEVTYDRIYGVRNEEYGDFDIIYFTGNELFLIESKYFTDSYTGNTAIGDYNKLFINKKNYYDHCRRRYDLVENEPDAMKKFVGATEDIYVHYLFVSSKPLEVEFQDEDKIVTFLSAGNFERYLEGKLESEDGSILRPTHVI